MFVYEHALRREERNMKISLVQMKYLEIVYNRICVYYVMPILSVDNLVHLSLHYLTCFAMGSSCISSTQRAQT